MNLITELIEILKAIAIIDLIGFMSLIGVTITKQILRGVTNRGS